MHARLREAVTRTLPARLEKPLPSSELTPLTLITGIAAHDLYHAGQIQLLKALQKATPAKVVASPRRRPT